MSLLCIKKLQGYLLSLYLDCPEELDIYCPTDEQVDALKQSITRGDITWHAMPFNAELELYTPSLLEAAIQLTHTLDDQFNLPHKITVSQRDVPGFSRAAIPILNSQGIKAVSVGVNGGSAPPGVPHNTPVIWRDPTTDTEMLLFIHPGGYSDYYPGLWDHFPDVGIQSPCVTLPLFNRALCSAWRNDNEGAPPSINDVLQTFELVQKDFPNAQVIVSTGFDEFVEALLDVLPDIRDSLPIFEGEIGDNWIYGIASDPGKISEYRAIARKLIPLLPVPDDSIRESIRYLMKIPEHTWGTDSKMYPGDFDNWSNADFYVKWLGAEADPKFSIAVDSWMKQRSYNQLAIEALLKSKDEGIVSVATSIQEEIDSLHQHPLVSLTQKDKNSVLLYSHNTAAQKQQEVSVDLGPYWKATLNTSTGAISKLDYYSYSNELYWSSGGGDSVMAEIQYTTYAEEDFNIIWDTYSWQQPVQWWFMHDLGKPGSNDHGAMHADNHPIVDTIQYQEESNGVLIESHFEEYLVQHYGAPSQIYTHIYPSSDNHRELKIDITWVNKTSTRLPEALWVKWRPDPHQSVDHNTWIMYKLGQPVSPLDVSFNGSYSFHTVDDQGVSVKVKTTHKPSDNSILKLNDIYKLKDKEERRLYIRSYDAALVSPGPPNPIPQVRPISAEMPIDMSQGMNFNLVNNLWGTNYVMWYPYKEEDKILKFRFAVELDVDAGGSKSTA